MSSPHKARKRSKKSPTPTSSAADGQGAVVPGSKSHAAEPAFPLAAFLWPAKKSTSQWVMIPLVLMVVGLYRWAAGFWGYSGFQVPPMHGDFEAQRHWMEITTHLPPSKWYFYDLGYWGLDYPPLTAYHSWLLGIIGSAFDPTWFALDTSRGLESSDLKLYMRATVIASEYLVYIPAVIIFNRHFARLSNVGVWESSVALVAILMQPSTILIDHAHFQYNTVMLGFVVASISSMVAGRLLWSCVFFVAALSFKQMALYYAPAVFAYLVGVCIQPSINVGRFAGIAIITLLAFGAMVAPLLLGAMYDQMRDPNITATLEPPFLYFLLESFSPVKIEKTSYLYPYILQLTQLIHRIFPLARGLFEDKVANLWCAIHTVYKLNRFPVDFLSRLSLLATLAAIMPSCVLICTAPRKASIPYALASCAWGFFLCSFQVHEKSVLLPLLPMTMLLGGKGGLGPEIRAWVGWANALGVWTMFPLLKRDELRVPYAVLSLLWAYLLDLPPVSFNLYLPSQRGLSSPTKILHVCFYAAMAGWHVLEALVAPPAKKPDLWVVLNCLIGAAGFGICYLWCTWALVARSGILESGYFQQLMRGSSSADKTVKAKANNSAPAKASIKDRHSSPAPANGTTTTTTTTTTTGGKAGKKGSL